MKKLIVTLLILLICISVVIGCGTPAPAAKTPATPAQSTTAAPLTSTVTMPPTSAAATPKSTATTKPTTTVTASLTPLKPVYSGTLRVISAGSPGTPIGWVPESAGGSITTMRLCLEFPLSELVDGTIQPNLAESYEVSTDPAKASITLHLRKGVKFHDGTDLNAQGVKWLLEKGKDGVNKSTTNYWKSFDVLDDYTLRINHTTWQNRMLRSFAALTTFIVSPAAFEKNGIEWMRWHMVGTGAFRQVDFQRDVTCVTTRVDNYWQPGKPYLQGITFLYVVDELTRVALFKSGGGDVMGVSPRIANELKAAGYNIISKQAGSTMLVPDSMNPSSPWSNPKVRMAAEYAIDKDALVKSFGYNYWKTAYQIPFESSKAYDPGIAPRKYDVTKAKQLLTEAGFPTGFKTKIICPSGGDKDVPVALQSYLGAIGIQVDLDFPESAKYQQIISGTWDNALIYNTLSDKPNYNVVINQYFGVPTTWFKSLEKPDGWDKALTASVNSILPDAKLMQQCVRLFYDNETVIPLYSGTSLWATTTKVHDTGNDTRASTDFTPEDTWLSK